MPDKTVANSDVLQSQHTSTLSAEQIAKAVARHDRQHKGGKQQAQAAQKPKSSGKR